MTILDPSVHTPLGPIAALDALEGVEAKLRELLPQLSAADWERPTIVEGWCVRHVVAHLLDTALRKLSVVRDRHAVERPASDSAQDVLRFVDRINAEGAAVYGRLSPAVLTALIERVSPDLVAFHRTLDPLAPAAFAVSWAGDLQSPNWFDSARELTERWHHQEQIRLAVRRPGIMTPELYRPVLDCFIRVLPHTFRRVSAPNGAHLSVRVLGPCGGEWRLLRGAEGWALTRGLTHTPVSTIAMPEGIAWRVFTKGIGRAEAERLVTIEGDQELGRHVLNAVAIVG